VLEELAGAADARVLEFHGPGRGFYGERRSLVRRGGCGRRGGVAGGGWWVGHGRSILKIHGQLLLKRRVLCLS
jgi:hypothetical protein